jgi:hypothetical protein
MGQKGTSRTGAVQSGDVNRCSNDIIWYVNQQGENP